MRLRFFLWAGPSFRRKKVPHPDPFLQESHFYTQRKSGFTARSGWNPLFLLTSAHVSIMVDNASITCYNQTGIISRGGSDRPAAQADGKLAASLIYRSRAARFVLPERRMSGKGARYAPLRRKICGGISILKKPRATPSSSTPCKSPRLPPSRCWCCSPTSSSAPAGAMCRRWCAFRRCSSSAARSSILATPSRPKR